jgi:hypothetical protein
VSWPIYSERFLHHQAQGFWEYTVPSGKRAVITNVDGVNASLTAGRLGVYIGDLAVFLRSLPASGGDVHFATRAVAYQRELIRIYIEVGGIHTTVSGFLFDDPSGRTGPPPGAGTLPAPGGGVDPLPAPASS